MIFEALFETSHMLCFESILFKVPNGLRINKIEKSSVCFESLLKEGAINDEIKIRRIITLKKFKDDDCIRNDV